MTKTVLRYGLFATIFIVLFFLATWRIMDNQESPDFKTQEIIGYTGMIAALLFVFAGIKHYMDKVNNGQLSFGKAMKIGLLISLIPAVIFGLFDLLYVLHINPEFVEKYYTYSVNEMKNSLPPAEFNLKFKELESQKAMFTNPVFLFGIMFMTVFLIGLIITVISAFILKRNKITI